MFGNSNYSPRPFGVGPALNGNALHDIGALAHSGAFKPQFRDSLNPNEDQSHHFAAYLELSTMTGKTAAEIYAWYSDGRHNQGPNKDQDNQGDVRLGDAAAEIGGMLHDKTLKPSEVGDWIRENICKP